MVYFAQGKVKWERLGKESAEGNWKISWDMSEKLHDSKAFKRTLLCHFFYFKHFYSEDSSHSMQDTMKQP